MNQSDPSTVRGARQISLNRWAGPFLLGMAMWIALASAYSVYRGSTHDYPAYVVIWELILGGGDPWLGSLQARNAYGPVNVVLAPLINIDPLLPKIVMLAVFLAVNALFAWKIAIGPSGGWRPWLYALFIPLNGSVIVWGVAYGGNDILVAGLVGLALLLRMEKHFVWAGLILGLAVLLKFYPALLVLLFSVDRKSITFRLLISSAMTVFIGLVIPFLIWGGNSLNWLLFAAERGTSQLSIWNLVQNEPSLAVLHGVAIWAIDFNAILLALVFGIWLAIVWVKRIAWLPASIFGFLIVLILYKVGHGQFWIAWLMLACGLLIATAESHKRLALSCLPAALGASYVGFIYDSRLQRGLPWDAVHNAVGWTLFVLTVITAVWFLVVLFRARDGEQQSGQNQVPSVRIASS